MRLKKNEIISAEVILRSASGQEIGPETLITSENLDIFTPPPDAYSIASRFFRSMGFEIGPMSGLSFSITAPVGIFEEMFEENLQRSVKGGIECVGGSLEFSLAYLPENIRRIIQTVTFTEPPDFGPTEFLE